MPDLPSGTVTFLMTDVEGSTRRWEVEPEAMPATLARHDALMTAVIAQHGGAVVKSKGEGDSLFAVFHAASDAAAAAANAQLRRSAEDWGASPLRVRMAIHAGEVEFRDGDYFGLVVNRCARLRGIAHGGQILLSASASAAASPRLPTGTQLIQMGSHRLKDLREPEDVFQLAVAGTESDFPPLDSLDPEPDPVSRTVHV